MKPVKQVQEEVDFLSLPQQNNVAGERIEQDSQRGPERCGLVPFFLIVKQGLAFYRRYSSLSLSPKARETWRLREARAA